MSENVYENTIILKNGASAPSESTLQKAELGFDTAHDILFIGRDSSSPIPLSPYFSPEAPSELNMENLLWVDTSNNSGVIPIEMGGTGANTATDAVINLGALPLSGGIINGNLEIKNLFTASGNIILSSNSYGSDDDLDKVTNPIEGQIFFVKAE